VLVHLLLRLASRISLLRGLGQQFRFCFNLSCRRPRKNYPQEVLERSGVEVTGRRLALVLYFVSAGAVGDGAMFQVCTQNFKASLSGVVRPNFRFHHAQRSARTTASLNTFRHFNLVGVVRPNPGCLVIGFPADFESHDVSGRQTGGFQRAAPEVNWYLQEYVGCTKLLFFSA
jgi:hypothetical protein